MSHSAYPAKADLDALIASAGIAAGTLDTQSAVDAGIRAFEEECGRRMLAGGADATATLDPPTDSEGFLWLPECLSSLTSVTYTPQGGSAQLLTLNTDYFAWPEATAAAVRGIVRPYEWLTFAPVWRWTRPLRPECRRSVLVVGKWGWGTAVPDDAWLSMLQYGASLLAVAAGAKLSGGIVRTESGGASTLWSDRPFAWHKEQWQWDWRAAVNRYKRISL